MKVAEFTKPFSFALTEETFKRMKAITDEQKISMAEFIRINIERPIPEYDNNKNQKPFKGFRGRF